MPTMAEPHPTKPLHAAMRQLEHAWIARARNRIADDMAVARAIDAARAEGETWEEIATLLGGEGRQFAYNLRRRLPDPE